MTPGDRQATFEHMLRHGRGRWAAVARAYDHADSEDLLQEILLQLWRSLPRFDGQSSSQTWAYRVAINTSLHWQRSAARRKKHVRDAAGPPGLGDAAAPRGVIEDAVAVATIADPAVVLDQFMGTLGDRDKAALLMYLDDLPTAEMAGVLGVTEGAIRVRMHRLENKLASFAEGQS